jgi:hypothetical protein
VADIGDEVAAHLLGLAQMGDVGEMQKQRVARRPAPTSDRAVGSRSAVMRTRNCVPPALSANSKRASPAVPSACTVSIRPRIDG